MANTVEITVKVNGDAARVEMKALENEAKASAGRQQSTWDKLGSGIGKSLKTGLTNALKGGGAGLGGFAGLSGALGLAGPLAGMGLAVGAFAAVAGPELKKVQGALSKTGTAGQKAWAQLTPGEKTVGRDVKGLQASFHGLQHEMQPVIDKTLALAAKLGKDLLPTLEPLVKAGGKVIDDFLKPLDKLISSPFFSKFTQQMSKLATEAGSVLGPQLVALLKVFMQLFMQAGPAGIQILKALVPAFVQLIRSASPTIVAFAKIVAAIITFLTKTHLLIPLLGVLAAAFLVVSGASGILAVTLAITVLIGAISYLASHWKQVWNGIKRVFDDAMAGIKKAWDAAWSWIKSVFDSAMGFIKSHWQLILGILTGPIGLAVGWIISHWHQVTGFFSSAVGIIRSAWNAVYSAIVSPVIHAYDTVVGFVDKIKGALGGIGSAVNNALGGIPGKVLSFLGLAHGGIVGAALGGVHGGLRMVGEHGPELVRLPSGSTVHSNPDTQRMLASGPGRAAKLVIELRGGGDAFSRFMLQWLRDNARTEGGGDVQVAFGWSS